MHADQGSTTSSSSDVLTLTTASSWCAMPTSTRIRVLRLVRPHTRRLLVSAPDCQPSYGFAVRGGKEYGTGFFVSSVERSSEADLKGLRIGDQILRINGYRVDDSVHKELVQFVTSQDRITLKVRGVGMLPIKENNHDRLSWHVVKLGSVSGTPSECSYKCTPRSTLERDHQRSKDICVVLNVAPRTKLGLGICKGPEWKPGIFVQFTKEKSVARESGLRPGDQILSVNSIDFSDVLFSEAVAVMKGSNKLEMLVRTAAGLDLFPGESSGYNSSASSVTGDQSPCWADAKSKRLTAVREETPTGNDVIYADGQVGSRAKTNSAKRSASAATLKKEVNKTIIKLSESGTSINNTYVSSAPHAKESHAIAPPPPPPIDSILQNGNFFNGDGKTIIADVHRNASPETDKMQHHSVYVIKQSTMMATTSANNNNHNNNNSSSSNNCTEAILSSVSAAAAVKASLFNASNQRNNAANYANINQQQNNNIYNNNHNNQNNNNNSNGNGNNINLQNMKNNANIGNNAPLAGGAGNCHGSSLSSAITEELKKRKEKQRAATASSSCDMNATTVYANKRPNNCNNNNNNNNRMHNGNASYEQQQQQQQQQSLMTSTSACARGRTHGTAIAASGGDQHSALMDEFMSFHQRMFKNGFHETEQERQEALQRTTMMEDDVNHRKSRILTTMSAVTQQNIEKEMNGGDHHVSKNTLPMHLPPPPPSFANATAPKQSAMLYKTSPLQQHQQQPTMKPPNSPVPDYDNVQLRGNAPRPASVMYANTYARESATSKATSANATAAASNRYTMRSGMVTIGQYEHQRKEPGKFDFLTTLKRNNQNNNSSQHVNGGNGGNGSVDESDANNAISLQSELQSTLSRVNLKKSNGHLEHQSNCPLQQAHNEQHQYRNASQQQQQQQQRESVQLITRKMHETQLQQHNEDALTSPATITSTATLVKPHNGNGILKNGTRSRTGSITKNTEKSIKFGN